MSPATSTNSKSTKTSTSKPKLSGKDVSTIIIVDQNKAETKSVKHVHGYSHFDETLKLEFNMVYNSLTHVFEQKNVRLF